MTDWWNTEPRQSTEERTAVPVAIGWDPEPEPAAPVHNEEPSVPEEPGEKKPDRRKGILLGAAGAAVAGILVFAAMPDGGSGAPAGTTEPSAASSQDGGLPAAGGGPGGAVGGASEESPTRTSARKPKTVTLSATPAGVGQVGAIVKVTITNNTDSAVIIMPSMVKGDGRAAVVGEGTLAPGSREVQPGETVTGTVEFASRKAPGQVVLVDLGGDVVAAGA